MPTTVEFMASRHIAEDGDCSCARCETQRVHLERWLESILAKAPPLTDEQRVRLAELLRPVRGMIEAD